MRNIRVIEYTTWLDLKVSKVSTAALVHPNVQNRSHHKTDYYYDKRERKQEKYFQNKRDFGSNILIRISLLR